MHVPKPVGAGETAAYFLFLITAMGLLSWANEEPIRFFALFLLPGMFLSYVAVAHIDLNRPKLH